MADVSVTWLGHASFRVDSPGGKRIYVDPWLGNPKCPDSEKEPERIDVIAITHGHGDHVGETVELSKQFKPQAVVANVELKAWLEKQGAEMDDLPGSNKGGTVEVDGVKVTLVNAFHSSGSDEGDYLGEAAGIVLELENGTKLYFAGDTCVFGDMQLIARIYSPDVAILPIGGHFTMDPREAGVALELLGTKRCIPCHYGTFPLLNRHARRAAQGSAGRRDHRAAARGDDHGLRQRWFGATGVQVPEIAVEGELELGDALVLDDVSDEAALKEAHEQGRAIVVRAGSPDEVKAALSRPEVASRARPRGQARAAGARPDGADLRLASSPPTRSPPATSKRRSGASPRSRSSSASARSSRGPSRRSGRSRPRPTRTRATGPTGSRCCGRARARRRSSSA